MAKKLNRPKRNTNLFSDIGKLPPSAIEFEEAILGSIILEYDKCYSAIGHFIKAKMFYKPSNQLIWEAIESLVDSKEPVEMLLVTNHLKRLGILETVGGTYYIVELTKKIATTVNIVYWARVVYQKYLQREIIRVSNDLSNKAFDDTEDVFDILEEAELAFKQLNVVEQETVTVDTKEASKKTFEQIMYFNDDDTKEKPYYRTGHNNFDNKVSFAPGISLWAGSAGIGKSIFNSFIMSQLLRYHDNVSIKWHCIDHEDEDRIIKRWISQRTGFTDNQLSGKDKKLSNSDLEIIIALKNTFDDYDIEFINKPSHIKEIHRNFIRFCEKRKDRFNILIVDNIMRLSDNRDSYHQLQIDENIANTLADIRDDTKKYNSHIMAMHHFTKEAIATLGVKQAFRPGNNHIRGSSRYYDVMEQIVLLNRPGNFEALLNDMKDQEDILRNMFITEVTKNSYGDTGTIRWWCDMSTCTFKEIE